jgi:hypothetical protein
MSYSVNLLELMGTKVATQVLFAENQPSETKMWQAVVMTAFEDVTNKLSDKKSSIAKWDAFKWFHDKHEFETVCYLADFDADYVYERYQRAIDKDIIVFTPRQLAWARYSEVINQYNLETDKKKRSKLKKQLEVERQRVMNATTVPPMPN